MTYVLNDLKPVDDPFYTFLGIASEFSAPVCFYAFLHILVCANENPLRFSFGPITGPSYPSVNHWTIWTRFGEMIPYDLAPRSFDFIPLPLSYIEYQFLSL